MGPGIGVLQLQVADHRDLVLDRGQRAEARGKLVQATAIAWRRPLGVLTSHRDVHEAQATHRTGWRLGKSRHRGNHRIQQGQRHRGAQAPQERAARECLLRDDQEDLRIWKGMLFTMPTTSDEKR